MSAESGHLIAALKGLPLFEAEWVLWFLLGLSALSLAVVFERLFFYWRHRVDVTQIKDELERLLAANDPAQAIRYLARFDSLETNAVLSGLRAHHRGPDAVEALVSGAAEHEQLRYGRWLGLLATVGSNAPFIGLFGTVLGIIRAFADLSGDLGGAGASVMSGISEALIATAVGLLVAIPAVVAYNGFQARVKASTSGASLLGKTLLAALKSEPSEVR